jgi:hypothetical protein
MFASDADLRTVAKLLRNRMLAMILRYAHLGRDFKLEAVRRLEQRFQVPTDTTVATEARLSRGQGKTYLSSWKLSYRTLLLFRANSAFGRHSTCTKSGTRKIRRRRPRGSRRSRFAPATPSALARSRKRSLRHCAGDCTFLCIECLTNASPVELPRTRAIIWHRRIPNRVRR